MFKIFRRKKKYKQLKDGLKEMGLKPLTDMGQDELCQDVALALSSDLDNTIGKMIQGLTSTLNKLPPDDVGAIMEEAANISGGYAEYNETHMGSNRAISILVALLYLLLTSHLNFMVQDEDWANVINTIEKRGPPDDYKGYQ